MVGLDGVDAALTLTVHAAADPDFQERVLTLATARVRSGEVRAGMGTLANYTCLMHALFGAKTAL